MRWLILVALVSVGCASAPPPCVCSCVAPDAAIAKIVAARIEENETKTKLDETFKIKDRPERFKRRIDIWNEIENPESSDGEARFIPFERSGTYLTCDTYDCWENKIPTFDAPEGVGLNANINPAADFGGVTFSVVGCTALYCGDGTNDCNTCTKLE